MPSPEPMFTAREGYVYLGAIVCLLVAGLAAWWRYQIRPETREAELVRRRREGTVIRMLGVEITRAEADAISADGP